MAAACHGCGGMTDGGFSIGILTPTENPRRTFGEGCSDPNRKWQALGCALVPRSGLSVVQRSGAALDADLIARGARVGELRDCVVGVTAVLADSTRAPLGRPGHQARRRYDQAGPPHGISRRPSLPSGRRWPTCRWVDPAPRCYDRDPVPHGRRGPDRRPQLSLRRRRLRRSSPGRRKCRTSERVRSSARPLPVAGGSREMDRRAPGRRRVRAGIAPSRRRPGPHGLPRPVDGR